jgi:plasmid stabilization system protein ParE
MKERPSSAEPFSDAVDATIAGILEDPHRYAIVERQSRRALVSGFQYAIYYRVGEGTVVILSCTHFRRHPRRRRIE